MKQAKEQRKNKGGRPVKAIKRNQVLCLKCAHYERARISANAKKAQMTVSEFLREMALNGQVVIRQKVLSKDALELKGSINNASAILNQLARKRNRGIDELNAAERAELKIRSRELKELAIELTNYLR